MNSINGDEMEGPIHPMDSPENSPRKSRLANMFERLKPEDAVLFSKRFEFQYHDELKQMPNETITKYIEKLENTIGRYTFPTAKAKESTLKTILTSGMISAEGSEKITRMKASWAEAKEIALQDEEEGILEEIANEAYDKPVTDKCREMREKNKETKNKTSTHTSKSDASVSNMGVVDLEVYVFRTLELVSLYVTMMLKRVVNNNLNTKNLLCRMEYIVESNLGRIGGDRQQFLHMLRDHARIYHKEWTNELEVPIRLDSLKVTYSEVQQRYITDNFNVHKSRTCYNTLLFVLSLKLGLEKAWVTEGHTAFNEKLLKEELSALYDSGRPTLALKQLSQWYPVYEYLANHSPHLQGIYLPRCTSVVFQSIQKFRCLRIIEFDGVVSDRELCNALWSLNKSSEKVVDSVLKQCNGAVIHLPHLMVLRSNIIQITAVEGDVKSPPFGSDCWSNSLPPTRALYSNMLVSVGAAALLLQSAMQTVENLAAWDTMGAVQYLLKKEAKQKKGGGLRLGLSNMTVVCEEKLDTKQLEQFVRACPKITTLTLLSTEHLDPHFSLLSQMLPMQQLTHLVLDATSLSGKDLTILLATTPNLEHLSLNLSPYSIAIQDMADSDFHKKMMGELQVCQRLHTLSLEFSEDHYEDEEDHVVECKAKAMMTFLNCFPVVTTLRIGNSAILPSAYLVYGCLGGALACLGMLQHLSVISSHPDLPHEVSIIPELEDTVLTHFKQVISMLPDIQDATTFVHLCKLKTFEIDELYLSPRVNRLIDAVRAEGVHVAVRYRSSLGMHFGRHDISQTPRPLSSHRGKFY